MSLIMILIIALVQLKSYFLIIMSNYLFVDFIYMSQILSGLFDAFLLF